MSQNAIKIIDRLKDELSIKTDKNLCKILGIRPNTLSTWKKRDTLDFNKIIELCEAKNLDLNFIFFDEEEKGFEEKNTVPILKDSTFKKSPEAKLFKEFQLINTNRNIALFQSVHSYHPLLESDMLVVGQKIRSKQIKEGVVYIIMFNINEVFIDELEQLPQSNNETAFRLKNYHPFSYNINPQKHIKHIWQFIDTVSDAVK